jgi:protein-L-isoaspartate(D-aspartate) O-methyltransferase
MTEREQLLAELRADSRVLAAVAAVPRELFVPQRLRTDAYANVALPIGCGQTISQPAVVAQMTALLELRPTDRVLDVGCGSGYHAAVLAQLCAHVYGIECEPELVARARAALRDAGVANVTVRLGDGYRGLPEEAPFDAINVAAAARGIVPPALERQLAEGGRLVAPVGGPDGDQRLVLVRRTEGGFERSQLDPVRFVALHHVASS